MSAAFALRETQPPGCPFNFPRFALYVQTVPFLPTKCAMWVTPTDIPHACLVTTCSLVPLSPIHRDLSEIQISDAGDLWGLTSSFAWEGFPFIKALTMKKPFEFHLQDHCWIVPGKAGSIFELVHWHSSLGFICPLEMKQGSYSICLHSTCPCVTGHLVHLMCIARLLFTNLFQCQFLRAREGGERNTGKYLSVTMQLTDL